MSHIGVRRAYLLPSRSGLGQPTPTLPIPAPSPATLPTDPLWARLTGAFATPIVGAYATRIAYGGGGVPPRSGGGYYVPYGNGGIFGFRGLSQSTLMVGALVLGAVLYLRR